MQGVRQETSTIQSMTGDQTENPTSEHLSTDPENSDEVHESRVQPDQDLVLIPT